MKKYEIDMSQTRTITVEGVEHRLHRIRAARRLIHQTGAPYAIDKGSLGGWVEGEENLSQSGECWVADEAAVFGKGWVQDNAFVCGNAMVYNRGWAFGDAVVCGCAEVRHGADVGGNVRIHGRAKVGGKHTTVNGYTVLGGAAVVDSGMDYITISVPWFGAECMHWITCYMDNGRYIRWDNGDGPHTFREVYETVDRDNPKMSTLCHKTMLSIEYVLTVAANEKGYVMCKKGEDENE